MSVTVKDAKKRIEDLQLVYDNAIKIQQCCLRNKDAENCVKELEEKAAMNTTLRNFASATASFISDEIHRLEKAIDSTVVKID